MWISLDSLKAGLTLGVVIIVIVELRNGFGSHDLERCHCDVRSMGRRRPSKSRGVCMELLHIVPRYSFPRHMTLTMKTMGCYWGFQRVVTKTVR